MGLGKKLLKTSPLGYAALKVIERKNDPEVQAAKQARRRARPNGEGLAMKKTLRWVAVGFVAFIALGAILSATSSKSKHHSTATSSSSPSSGLPSSSTAGNVSRSDALDGNVSRSDALEDVINQIDAGPSWETKEMSDAVGANLNGKSGANDGCAWIFNVANQRIPGFACYLEYVDPSAPDADPQTGDVDVYFGADGHGKHIHPISTTTYNDLT